MMNDPVQYHLSPDVIRELPISTKEDNHPSRQRLGYHLFLGYYFSKCSELSPAEKHASFLDDNTSFDSTDDPPVLHASVAFLVFIIPFHFFAFWVSQKSDTLTFTENLKRKRDSSSPS